MALQTTVDTFRSRFVVPLKLLSGFLREWNISTGTLADVEPFAELLEAPGIFAEAMATTLQELISAECTAPTRMEMLELLCIAVSGTDVEGSGPSLRRATRQMLVFINGVLLSMQESAPEAENTEHCDCRARGEDEFAAGSNPYVLETFDLTSPPIRVKAAGETAAKDTAKLNVAYREPLHAPVSGEESFEDALFTTPRETYRSPDELPGASLTSAAFRQTELATGLDANSLDGFALRSHPDNWSDDEEAEDGEETKKQRLLSQPALLACAVVVAFGCGMLVPRHTPQIHPRLESVGKAQGTGLGATAGDSLNKGEMLRLSAIPSSSPPLQSNLPNNRASNDQALAAISKIDLAPPEPPSPTVALRPVPPQASPVTARSAATDPHIPANVLLNSGSQPAATVPSQAALAHLIHSPQPQYPALAKLTNVEGEVVLAIVVSPQGSVVAVKVLQGQPLLRGSAESAVRHWQFRPFIENGKAAPILTSVVVDVRPPL